MSRQAELKSFSDTEINELVDKLALGSFDFTIFENCNSNPYCSNPNCIMPIAFENKIYLIYQHCDEVWEAVYDEVDDQGPFTTICVESADKPLRAICETYILMMEAKL